MPFKILDAPKLEDDYYLNLLDWSSQNVLAVGLASSVYLWSAHTSRVTKLCDIHPDKPTSVRFSERGLHLAVGTDRGLVLLFDVATGDKLRSLGGHDQRVGCLSWSQGLVASGSRDHSVLERDVRVPQVHSTRLLSGHRQEVCGLSHSPDGIQLASGGNDNMLLIWDSRMSGRARTGDAEGERAVVAPLLEFGTHEGEEMVELASCGCVLTCLYIYT